MHYTTFTWLNSSLDWMWLPPTLLLHLGSSACMSSSNCPSQLLPLLVSNEWNCSPEHETGNKLPLPAKASVMPLLPEFKSKLKLVFPPFKLTAPPPSRPLLSLPLMESKPQNGRRRLLLLLLQAATAAVGVFNWFCCFSCCCCRVVVELWPVGSEDLKHTNRKSAQNCKNKELMSF